jgi:predicted dehydrogenase
MSTRRQLIVQAAALAAAPFVSTSLSRALAAAAKKKLGFALCGLGSLSTHQIAPALQKTDNCRLAGIITGTPAKAVRWKAQYGIADKNIYNYQTMHRIADDPEIDVVYVVTPNALHLDYALIAAKAGMHVFCEKPMEISVARCRQMIDAVKASNRVLGVGYRCRFEPHHLECMRLARSKEFGALKLIDAYFGYNSPASVWRLDRALAGGGPLMDVGIYALQASRYLTGEEPVRISARTGKPIDLRTA